MHVSVEQLVKFENFSVYWDKTAKPILKDINLKLQKNKLIGVFGITGCGKSTFLNIFLKELPYC
jgi:ABC-type bacteriocin/lantibiotic exporter with double-glycine peptidase domain